jgi:NitT/TauT family transport system substrate-binding protein
LKRRDLLITLGAVGLAWPRSAVAQGSGAPAIVRIGMLPGDDNFVPIYAEETGVFRRYALTPQYDLTLSGGRVLEALKAGTVDVGFSNTISIAKEIQNRAPFVLLAPGSLYDAATPSSELVQAPASNFRTGADLNGKIVDSPSGVGSLGALGPQLWIDKTGGDSRTVKLVTGVPLSRVPEALRSGEIDAAEMTEPEKTRMLQHGEIKILAPTFNAVAPKFMIGAWVASRAWVDANPEAARRFAQAMRETAHWANAHRAETAAIITKHLNLEPAVVAAMTRPTYAEEFRPAWIQPTLDLAAKYGVIKPMTANDLLK